MIDDFITTLSSKHGTAATPVIGADFRHINQRLLESFFPNVKRATGKWVYDDYRWHAYSFNYEIAISGDAAFNRYAEQGIQPFYIYQEFDDSLLDCTAAVWPDIRTFDNDIYVFPHDLTWLFSTTHEMSIGLGPFFAVPSA